MTKRNRLKSQQIFKLVLSNVMYVAEKMTFPGMVVVS